MLRVGMVTSIGAGCRAAMLVEWGRLPRVPVVADRHTRPPPAGEPVAARPAAAVADQVGRGSGAEFALENFLELREVGREVAAVHAMAQGASRFCRDRRAGRRSSAVRRDSAFSSRHRALPWPVPASGGFAAQRAPGEDAEQREFGRRQEKTLPAARTRRERGRSAVRRGQRAAGGFDGLVVAGATGQQRFGQAVAQADEGQFGERHLRLALSTRRPPGSSRTWLDGVG
jgi:hypothetical protein